LLVGGDEALLSRVHLYSGAVFIIGTAVLIYVLVRHTLKVMAQENETHRATLEALHEREATLRGIFLAAPVGIGLVKAGRVLGWANEHLTRMLGYTAEELEGQSARILYDSDEEYERVAQIKHPQIEAHNVGTVETRFRRKDGSLIDVSLTSATLEAGHMEKGLVFTALDITERKQVEQALREAEARYRRLVEQMPGAFYLADLNETFSTLYISPQIERITGFTAEEYITSPDLWYRLIHRDDRQEVLAAFNRTREKRRPFLQEYRAITRDGRLIWLRDEAIVLEDESGNPAYIQGMLLDITGRKQAEEALRRRSTEISLLYQLSQELNRSLRLESVYDALFSAISQVMPCDGLYISSYNPEDQLIRCTYARHEGRRLDASQFPPLPLEPEGRGTQSRVIRSGEPLRLGDYQEYVKTSQKRYSVSEDGVTEGDPPEDAVIVRSALIVPIRLEEQVVGVLQVFSYQSEAYTQDNLHLCEALATQAAVAARNALLYEQSQSENTARRQAEEAEREQRALAEALRDTAAALTGTLDLDEVLERILDNIGRVVPHDLAHILLVEEGVAHVVRYRGHTVNKEEEVLGRRLVVAETRNLREMTQTGQPFIIPDVQTDPLWIPGPETGRMRAHLGAPIRAGNETVGFITVAKFEPDFYTAEHAERLAALADQAAIAIRNARLYRESQIQNQRLATLNAITRIGTATLDLEELLQKIADTAASIIGGDGCYITLWDTENRWAIPMAASGTLREEYRKLFPPQPGEKTLTEYVLHTGRPLAVEDVFNCPHLSRHIVERFPAHSVVALPLQADGRDLGGMLLAFNNPHHFTEDEVSWAAQAAELVALAIAKAQAYAELEQRVRERTAELQAAHDRLVKLSSIKDEFVANISHELRTPIASLKLYHHLLTARPDKAMAYLERLNRETDRLEFIVEDLLFLSRMDQGQITVNPSRLNLNALISVYVTDRAMLAEQRGLRIAFKPQPDLPAVMGDPMLLGHTLDILMANALHYTPSGGRVTLRTRTRRREGKTWVTVSVSDTGDGIQPDEMPHLFERFFRGRAGRASGEPGTGLGLATAKEIVERHHGYIEAASKGEPGKGATFTVWLPVAEESGN
jgi:PAS domain S-box-containing protein